MSQNDSINILINKMVDRIVNQFHPYKIILFGSHARGTAGPDSDIDLLIVMDWTGSKREISVHIRCALHNIDIPKDIFIISPAEATRLRNVPGTLIMPALTEGKVLYERAA